MLVTLFNMPTISDIVLAPLVWSSAVVLFLLETCRCTEEGGWRTKQNLKMGASELERMNSRLMLNDDEFSELCENLEKILVPGEGVEGLQIRPGRRRVMNVLSVGILGSGRSSCLNTILDQKVCAERGGQIQGTKGCEISDKAYFVPYFVESEPSTPEIVLGSTGLTMQFIDAEGLRRDQIANVDELAAHFGQLVEPLESFENGKLSHVFFTMDVESRANEAILFNLMSLMEAFHPLQKVCYLCITKWHSNSVMSEWNSDLLQWIRVNRKVLSINEIKGNPPTPSEMQSKYEAYLKTLQNDLYMQRFQNLLAFFEERVVWAYNLDDLQYEDRLEGELPVFQEKLYSHYRNVMIEQIRSSPLMVSVSEVPLVRRKNSLESLAKNCVSNVVKNRFKL